MWVYLCASVKSCMNFTLVITATPMPSLPSQTSNPPTIPSVSNVPWIASEEFAQVPFPVLSSHLPFSLQRRKENQRRLADCGPEKELLLNLPEDGPGCYFKRFSHDGRVKLFKSETFA